MQITTTPRLVHVGRFIVGRTLLHAVLIAGALFTSVPVYYMFSTSFKSEAEVLAVPIHWLPHEFQRLDNYFEAFETAPFGRYFLTASL